MPGISPSHLSYLHPLPLLESPGVFEAGVLSSLATCNSILLTWFMKATHVTCALNTCKIITGVMEGWFLSLISKNSFMTLWLCTKAHIIVTHLEEGSVSVVALAAPALTHLKSTNTCLMHAETSSKAFSLVASDVVKSS
jgi:hypothetical protein